MSPAIETPRIVADTPLADNVQTLLAGRVEVLPWDAKPLDDEPPVRAIYTYGHPTVDSEMLDRYPDLLVVSNYGVGVDHIDLQAAAARNLPVGNTPGILNGATADMAWALLLAAGRRLVEGDRYARSPEFTRYDPGYMLGREVHGATLGILGMGRIGAQVARRARAFDMPVIYHNRNRSTLAEQVAAQYVQFDELLSQSDYLVLCLPLNKQTRGIIGRDELARMKPTATLVNVARGAVVDTDAVTEALQQRRIYAAALDVTDPEPLPRTHPLLQQDNLVIAPHLGSATEQTRQRMAEISVENLLLGLQNKPLKFRVESK